MGAYVVMAFSADGELAGLDTLSAADDALAAILGPGLAPTDADRVEIWRDAELVHVIGAAPAAPDWHG